MKRKGNINLSQVIILLAIFIIVGSSLSCCVGVIFGPIEYSSGFREGNLQKFSKKGFLYKSWEGELALPGWQTVGENGGVSNVFAFSVEDEEIVKEIQKLHTNQKVRLHYTQYLGGFYFTRDTNYLITKVEILEK